MKPRNQSELICYEVLEAQALSDLTELHLGGLHVADGACLLASALGDLLGHLQIYYAMHAENCDKCSERKPEFHDTFIRDFTAAFSEAHRSASAKRDAGTAAADQFLQGVLKGHK